MNKQEIWKKIVDNPEYKRSIEKVPPREKALIESTLGGPFLDMLVTLEQLVDKAKQDPKLQDEIIRALSPNGAVVKEEVAKADSPSEG